MKLRLAIRSLLKNPFVTIVAVASLALGIGANAAIFSLFHQVLLRNLPVPEPDRLVNFSSPGPKQGSNSCGDIGDCDSVFSYPMFRDLQRTQTVFTGIAAHVYFSANLSFNGQTQSGRGAVVSGSYFPVLGLQPAFGRLFGPADDATLNEPHAVVLSHAYWRLRFNEDRGVLGQPIIINGQPMTVIGVTPPDFDGTTVGMRPQVFVPMTMLRFMWPDWNGFEDRRTYFAYLFARLKPGLSMAQAEVAVNGPYRSILNEVEAPLQRMSDQTMARFKAKQVRLAAGNRGQSVLHTEAQVPATLLLGVTAFVLLIACSNIANLLLARAANRAGEMAVRLSIGANRRHLVTQLLGESCLLAALGGLAGLVVAQWTLNLIATLVPAEVTQLRYELDSAVLLFAAALTVGTGILFGLYPALHSSRPDLITALRGQSGQPAGARSAARFRAALVTAQIALSMALLIVAGLFTKSLFNINRADLGFAAENVVTFGVSPGLNGYTGERSQALFERIEDELRALPGVLGVTASSVPLVAGDNWGTGVKVQGFQSAPDADNGARYSMVGEDYFRTLGIPLISGRDFTRADGTGSKVVVVNQDFVRKFNLGQDAVGKRMSAGSDPLDAEIIGVARNSSYSDVKEEASPIFFMPYRQNRRLSRMHFYVRTSLNPEQMLGTIAPAISRVDPSLPVEDPKTLPQQVRANTTMDRVISILSAAFAGVATVLAAIGLYGVLAYTVTQRTREFGVRMALGAAPERVRGMVLRQVGWMTLIGGAIGLAGAVAIGRFAESLLFRLNGRDPVVLAAGAAVLTIVAFAAGFLPAHRASRVDPMRALRYE